MEIKIIEIDCKELMQAEDLHECLKKQLHFPDYYGKNLDALYDCLCDQPCTCIVLKNAEELDKDEYGKSLLECFEDASANNVRLGLIEA